MSIVIPGINDKPINELKQTGGGLMQTQGGLNKADLDFKNYLYNRLYDLPENYEGFDGTRFQAMSGEEQSLLRQLQAGGGYSPLFDKARTNLGLAGDVYQNQMNVTDQDLVNQAFNFQNPFLAGIESQIGGQLTQSLADANIQNSATAFGSGAGGGSRQGLAMQPTQEALFKGAGDAIANARFSSYTDALNRARQANLDRARSADSYSNYVNQDLGLGINQLDKDFNTRLGALRDQRNFDQRQLDFDYQEDVRERMYPMSRLALMSNVFGSIPIEDKVVEQKPAEGGKSGII